MSDLLQVQIAFILKLNSAW